MSASSQQPFPRPLIDLHCHLEGSIDPSISYEILHARGHIAAAQRGAHLARITDFSAGQPGFFGAISALDACLVDHEAVVQVVADLMSRAGAQGVKLLELSFAPREFKRLAQPSDDLHAFTQAVVAGVEQAAADHDDLEVGLTMLVMPRHLSAEYERRYGPIAEHIRTWREHLGAVDLCSLDAVEGVVFEQDDPKRVAELVRSEGLHLSAHAGEFEGPKPLEQAIALGVQRIGHGICATQYPHIVGQLIEHDVTLEICPSSNYRTGAIAEGQPHPLPALLRDGVAVTINTDDAGVQRSDWQREYWFAVNELGLSLRDVEQCLHNAYTASFIPAQRKQRFRSRFLNMVA